MHGEELTLTQTVYRLRKTFQNPIFLCFPIFFSETVQLKPHSVTMKIRLASLLSSNQIYRQHQGEGYDEALRIYRECEAGQCSSEVCHKLGKFYDNRVIHQIDFAFKDFSVFKFCFMSFSIEIEKSEFRQYHSPQMV